MTNLARRLFDLLMAHRLLATLALVGATALMCAGASRLSFDNSYRIWFLEDDPALKAYDDFLELFGSDESMIVALSTKGEPYSTRTLAMVHELSTALAREEGIIDVWSLTHMEAMTDAGGALEVKKLIPRVPPDPVKLRQVKALVRSSPLYRPLVSRDGQSTSILLNLEQTKGSFTPKAELVRRVRRLAADVARGRQVWIAGGPVLDEAMYRYSEQDMMLYTPVMLLIISITLGWLFRSLVAVVAPAVVVFLSVGWALGFSGWMGWDANLLTTVLPAMIAAVGIADSVHMLQQFRLYSRQGMSRDEALREAFGHMLRPCFITSITTAAGMASLAAASLAAMREMGLTAAVGVIAAFLLTMLAIPVCFSLLPPRRLGGLVKGGAVPSPPWLERVTAFSMAHRRKVAALTSLLVILAAVGFPRITVGTSMVSYFFEDDPVYQESLAVDRILGGTLPLQVLVEARGQKDLLEPDALARVEAMGAYLQTLPATSDAVSGVDFIKEARRVILGDPPHKLARPASRQEAAQILLLLEGEGDTSRFISEDNKRARIEVSVEAGRYEELVRLTPTIEQRLARISGEVVTARITGLGCLLGAMEEYILQSQLRSFGLAFLLVMGIIAILFRSLRVGLLSAIPNLLPLVLTLGVMSWVGVRLDSTTVMIAPILLGIVVDDTVHVLERVLEGRRQGMPVDIAFRLSVSTVGHAVLLTTIILFLGFLTPLMGSFKPNLYFALLSALALVLALVADLVVFPAVARLCPWLVPRG